MVVPKAYRQCKLPGCTPEPRFFNDLFNLINMAAYGFLNDGFKMSYLLLNKILSSKYVPFFLLQPIKLMGSMNQFQNIDGFAQTHQTHANATTVS